VGAADWDEIAMSAKPILSTALTPPTVPDLYESLYDSDVVRWAEEQAQALRARSVRALDWDNLAEEIAAIARSEIRATTGPLKVAMRHKLLLLGWPGLFEADERYEVRAALREALAAYLPGMHRLIESMMPDLYVDALDWTYNHTSEIHAVHVKRVPLPADCPWTLDALLADAEVARRWKPEAQGE
jgi:hypothetical protein